MCFNTIFLSSSPFLDRKGVRGMVDRVLQHAARLLGQMAAAKTILPQGETTNEVLRALH